MTHEEETSYTPPSREELTFSSEEEIWSRGRRLNLLIEKQLKGNRHGIRPEMPTGFLNRGGRKKWNEEVWEDWLNKQPIDTVLPDHGQGRVAHGNTESLLSDF